MKILVYGFKPYKNYTNNISEQIIKKLPNRPKLIKIIFPVQFQQGLFVSKIKKYNPNIILGLGQHPRAKKIRLERKAVNLYGKKKELARIIVPHGTKYKLATWKLKPDPYSYISYNAGKYVCNFSMYVIANFIKHTKIKFAFIHIPHNYALKMATRFVEDKLKAYA